MRCASPRLIVRHSSPGRIRGTRSSGNGRSRAPPSAPPVASNVMPCCRKIASRRRPAATSCSGPSACSPAISSVACGRGRPCSSSSSSKKCMAAGGGISFPGPDSSLWREGAALRLSRPPTDRTRPPTRRYWRPMRLPATTPTLAVAVALCALAVPAPASASLAFAPCPGDGNQCATLTVPLDPSGALPGSIALHVERELGTGAIRSTIVELAGGPGQAATPLLQDTFDELGLSDTGRQIVAFDQRGTGRSGLLRCPEARARRPAELHGGRRRLRGVARSPSRALHDGALGRGPRSTARGARRPADLAVCGLLRNQARARLCARLSNPRQPPAARLDAATRWGGSPLSRLLRRNDAHSRCALRARVRVVHERPGRGAPPSSCDGWRRRRCGVS